MTGRPRTPGRAAAVAALVAAIVGAAARDERPERDRAEENDLTEVRHDEGR